MNYIHEIQLLYSDCHLYNCSSSMSACHIFNVIYTITQHNTPIQEAQKCNTTFYITWNNIKYFYMS